MDVVKCTKLKGRLQSRRGEFVYRQFLHNATCSLTFSKEVVWELGSIPYSQADFHWLFKPSGLLSPITRVKTLGKRDLNCPPHSTSSPGRAEGSAPLAPPARLSPLPALQLSQTIPLTAKESFTLPIHQQGGLLDSCKRKSLLRVTNVYNCLKEAPADDRSKNCHWDEFILKKLTKTTAQWIVSQQIPNHSQNKPRLQSLLRARYGSASATDLVSEEPMREEDFCRVRRYSVFPACRDEPGGLNQTATVTVKHTETPQPRPGHVLHTENNLEQELFSGKQVHQRDQQNRDRLATDDNSENQKNLQELFRCTPENWTVASTTAAQIHGDAQDLQVGTCRVKKGVCWVYLPTSADYATEGGLQTPDYSGRDAETPRQQPLDQTKQELPSLRYAVEEWRSAWQIKTMRSVTIEGLKKALTDLHHPVRLSAIATCASGAVGRPREEARPTAQYGRARDVHSALRELQPLLLQALEDRVRIIQMAAAVCQYATGTPDARAREILRNALCQDFAEAGADSWVAAQCLAMEGDHSRAVIQRLLSQHFLSEAQSDKEQAAALLVSISSQTTLVRSLLAEELKCASWQTRLLACDTISQLKSPINKDVTKKLIDLMWNDWHGHVRQTAAQALGTLGKGQDVHNELRLKLENGPAPWRVVALILAAQLHIMTANLLPIFQRCLTDNSVAVRKQACLTAAALMMKDKTVLHQLIQVTQNDPVCDVKVVAINALGKIGCLTPALQDRLLWALRHDEEPRVRIAACEVLKILQVKGPELQNLLQERFILEPHPQVHRHIKALLKHYGYSLEGDKDMVGKIKDQVKRLCTKRIITDKVLLLEELEGTSQQHRGFLGNDMPPISQLLQERYRGVKHSPSTTMQLHSTEFLNTQACSECSPVPESSSPVSQQGQEQLSASRDKDNESTLRGTGENSQ